YFYWRPIDKVLVDPHLNVGDIRHAAWVVDVNYMDFYQLDDLRKAIENAIKDGESGNQIKGWKIPSEAELKAIWNNPGDIKGQTLETEQATYIEGVVHHAEKTNIDASPDPL